MALSLPNSIDNDTPADAAELQENFSTIQTYVNTNLINRDGSVSLTSPLLLPGDPSQTNHAANKGYVDAQSALQVNKTGDTVTGTLTAARLLISGAQQTTATDVPRMDYMNAQIAAEATARTAAVAAEAAARVANDALQVDKAGDEMSGGLYVGIGSDPFAGATGSMIGGNAIACNSNVVGQSTLYLFRNPPAWADGQAWVSFCGSTGSYVMGTITMAPGGGASYNTSSDYRLKDDLGPIVDPVGQLMALQPKHLRWKSDQSEFDGFIAHEVDEVVPTAVTGAKDAVKPDDDQFDPGGVDPQMLDVAKLVPLLTAALQNALERIAVLEAAA